MQTEGSGPNVIAVEHESEEARQHRGRSRFRRALPVNVGRAERWISAAAGAGLATLGAVGFSRRKWTSGIIATGLGTSLLTRGITGHCFGYRALGIDRSSHDKDRVHVVQSFTIQRSPEDLYRFWRKLDNLPQVLRHIESVHVLNDRESHWIAKGPFGREVRWQAEITDERENERIAWRSLPGGDIETSGEIRFARPEGDRGTVVWVSIEYRPPAGQVMDKALRLFRQGLEQKLTSDLRNFKSFMEAGEIPTTEGQPSGRERLEGAEDRGDEIPTGRPHPAEAPFETRTTRP